MSTLAPETGDHLFVACHFTKQVKRESANNNFSSSVVSSRAARRPQPCAARLLLLPPPPPSAAAARAQGRRGGLRLPRRQGRGGLPHRRRNRQICAASRSSRELSRPGRCRRAFGGMAASFEARGGRAARSARIWGEFAPRGSGRGGGRRLGRRTAVRCHGAERRRWS